MSAVTGALPDPFAAGARIGRAGALCVVLLFGAAALWLVFASLNGAVVVPAQVKVADYRKTVQHLEGGIVQALFVKSGDRVSVGQPLLQLEEVQADAAVASLQDQLDAEQARSMRANAERLLQTTLVWPAETRTRAASSIKLASLLKAEAELFTTRRTQLVGQTTLLNRQAVQVGAELQGLHAQIESADKNRQLLADELAMNQDLFKREYVQKTRVMAFERALADKDEARGAHAAEQAKAQQKKVEMELKAIALKDDYLKRAADEYADSNRRVLELEQRLRPLRSTLARQLVVAPADGIVVDLRVHTVGGVVGPKDVLMEIVPQTHELIVEGKVRPEDVADLAPGQPVDIQVTAFKARATPMLHGALRYVSADALTDTAGGTTVSHYLVQVSVDSASERTLPEPLSPGMPATLFIQTRTRSALDYLLQPLTDSVQRAFKER